MQIKIKIRRLQDPDINIVIDDQSQVIDLKKCIETKVGLNPESQRLIFYGRVLNNHKKLKDYNIQDNVVVHMVQNIPMDPNLLFPDGQSLGVFPDLTIRFDIEDQSPTATRLRSLHTVIYELRIAICAIETEDNEDDMVRTRDLSSSHLLVFSDMLDELRCLHNRFAPLRDNYLNIIQSFTSNFGQLDEIDFNGSMSYIDRVGNLYHLFAHSYHIISDMCLMVSRQGAVLASEAFARNQTDEHDFRISETFQNNEPSNLEAADPITIQVQIETLGIVPTAPGSDLDNNANRNLAESQAEQRTGAGSSPNTQHNANSQETRNPDSGLQSWNPPQSGPTSTQLTSSLQRSLGDSNAPGGLRPNMYVAQMPATGEQPVDILRHIVSSVFRNGFQGGDRQLLNSGTEFLSAPTRQTMPNINLRTTSGSVAGPAVLSTTLNAAPHLTTVSAQAPSPGRPPINTSSHAENEHNAALQDLRTVSISNVIFDETLSCESRHIRRTLHVRGGIDPCEFPPRFNDASSSRAYNSILALYNNLQGNPDSTIISFVLLLREAIVPVSLRFLNSEELRRVGDVLQTYLRSLTDGEEDSEDIERIVDAVIENHQDFFNNILPEMILWPLNININETLRAVLRHYMKGILRLLSLRAPEDFCRTLRTVLPVVFHDVCQVLYRAANRVGNFFNFAGRRFLTLCLIPMQEINRDLILQPANYCLAMARHRLVNNRGTIDRFVVTNAVYSDDLENEYSPSYPHFNDLDEVFITQQFEDSTPADDFSRFRYHIPPGAIIVPVAYHQFESGEIIDSITAAPDLIDLDSYLLTGDSDSLIDDSDSFIDDSDSLIDDSDSPESLTSEMPTLDPPTDSSSERTSPEIARIEPMTICLDEAQIPARELVMPESPVLPPFSTAFYNQSETARLSAASAPITPSSPIASTSDYNTSSMSTNAFSSYLPDRQTASNASSSILSSSWRPEEAAVMEYDMASYIDRPPSPFSDAYISGMSPREQEAAREDRPPADINSFIEEVLNTLGEGDEVDSRMRNIFIPFLREEIMNRSEGSLDAQSSRYIALQMLRNPSPTDQDIERLREAIRQHRSSGPRS